MTNQRDFYVTLSTPLIEEEIVNTQLTTTPLIGTGNNQQLMGQNFELLLCSEYFANFESEEVKRNLAKALPHLRNLFFSRYQRTFTLSSVISPELFLSFNEHQLDFLNNSYLNFEFFRGPKRLPIVAVLVPQGCLVKTYCFGDSIYSSYPSNFIQIVSLDNDLTPNAKNTDAMHLMPAIVNAIMTVFGPLAGINQFFSSSTGRKILMGTSIIQIIISIVSMIKNNSAMNISMMVVNMLAAFVNLFSNLAEFLLEQKIAFHLQAVFDDLNDNVQSAIINHLTSLKPNSNGDEWLARIITVIVSMLTVGLTLVGGVAIRDVNNVSNLFKSAESNSRIAKNFAKEICKIMFTEEEQAVTGIGFELTNTSTRLMYLMAQTPLALFNQPELADEMRTIHATLPLLLEKADRMCKDASRENYHSLRASLTMQLTTLNTRIQELNALRTLNFKRDPVVVVFHGEPNIGKSEAMNLFISKVCERMGFSSSTYNMKRGDSKYWPFYKGEIVGKYEEFLATVDDPLIPVFNEMCSGNPFNMPGASIAEKHQWMQMGLIVMTTNTKPSDLSGCMEYLVPTARAAFWDRQLWYNFEDPVHPVRELNHTYNHRRPDFSHLTFRKCVGMKETKQDLLEGSQIITFDQMVDDVVVRFKHRESNYLRNILDSGVYREFPDFLREIERKRNFYMGNDLVPNGINSRPYVIRFQGTCATGKGDVIQPLAQMFAEHFGLGLYNVNPEDLQSPCKITTPRVFLIDDILTSSNIPCYVHYANTLPTGSVILLGVNEILRRPKSIRKKLFDRVLTSPALPPWYVPYSGLEANYVRRSGVSGEVFDKDGEKHTLFTTDSLCFTFSESPLITLNEDPACLYNKTGVIELCRQHFGMYMKTIDGIIFVNKKIPPEMFDEADVLISAPSLEKLFDMMKDKASYIHAYLSKSSECRVFMNKQAYLAFNGGEVSDWTYTGGRTKEDLELLVRKHAFTVFKRAPHLSLGVKCGNFKALVKRGEVFIDTSSDTTLTAELAFDLVDPVVLLKQEKEEILKVQLDEVVNIMQTNVQRVKDVDISDIKNALNENPAIVKTIDIRAKCRSFADSLKDNIIDFWEQYKTPMLWVGGVAMVLAVAYGLYRAIWFSKESAKVPQNALHADLPTDGTPVEHCHLCRVCQVIYTHTHGFIDASSAHDLLCDDCRSLRPNGYYGDDPDVDISGELKSFRQGLKKAHKTQNLEMQNYLYDYAKIRGNKFAQVYNDYYAANPDALPNSAPVIQGVQTHDHADLPDSTSRYKHGHECEKCRRVFYHTHVKHSVEVSKKYKHLCYHCRNEDVDVDESLMGTTVPPLKSDLAPNGRPIDLQPNSLKTIEPICTKSFEHETLFKLTARNAIQVFTSADAYHGLGLWDRYFICPYHAFVDTKVCTIFCDEYPKGASAKLITHSKTRDLAFCVITEEGFPPFRDIRGHFSTPDEFVNGSLAWFQRPGTVDAQVSGHATLTKRRIEPYVYKNNYEPQEMQVELVNISYSPNWGLFKVGDCGLPILIQGRTKVYIAAIHNGVATAYTLFSYVGVEDIAHFSKLICNPVEPNSAPLSIKPPTTQARTIEGVEFLVPPHYQDVLDKLEPTDLKHPYFPVLGYSKDLSYFQNSKDPYDFLGDADLENKNLSGVSVRTLTDRRIKDTSHLFVHESTKQPSLIWTTIKDMGSKTPGTPRKHIYDYSSQFVDDLYRQRYGKCRLLSDHEAINGCFISDEQGRGGIYSVSLDSSCGPYFQQKYKTQIKGDLVRNKALPGQLPVYDFALTDAGRELKAMYEDSIYAMQSGIPYLTGSRGCLKTELRPLKHVQKPKTRLFNVMDMSSVLVQRKLYGDFMHQLKRHKNFYSSCVGGNPYQDMNIWWNYLNEIPGEVKSWDAETFDKRHPFAKRLRFAKLVCTLVAGKDSFEECPETLRNFFIAEATSSQFSLMFIEAVVILVKAGLLSGEFVTGILNEYCMMDLTYYVACCAFYDQQGRLPTYQELKDIVRIKILGDDNTNKIDAGFPITDEYWKERASELNIILTPSHKGDTDAPTTFLSRNFNEDAVDPHYKVLFPGLKKVSLLHTLHYVKSRTVENYVASFNNTILEAGLWDMPFYLSIVSDVRRQVSKLPMAMRAAVNHKLLHFTYPEIRRQWFNYIIGGEFPGVSPPEVERLCEADLSLKFSLTPNSQSLSLKNFDYESTYIVFFFEDKRMSNVSKVFEWLQIHPSWCKPHDFYENLGTPHQPEWNCTTAITVPSSGEQLEFRNDYPSSRKSYAQDAAYGKLYTFLIKQDPVPRSSSPGSKLPTGSTERLSGIGVQPYMLAGAEKISDIEHLFQRISTSGERWMAVAKELHEQFQRGTRSGNFTEYQEFVTKNATMFKDIGELFTGIYWTKGMVLLDEKQMMALFLGNSEEDPVPLAKSPTAQDQCSEFWTRATACMNKHKFVQSADQWMIVPSEHMIALGDKQVNSRNPCCRADAELNLVYIPNPKNIPASVLSQYMPRNVQYRHGHFVMDVSASNLQKSRMIPNSLNGGATPELTPVQSIPSAVGGSNSTAGVPAPPLPMAATATIGSVSAPTKPSDPTSYATSDITAQTMQAVAAGIPDMSTFDMFTATAWDLATRPLDSGMQVLINGGQDPGTIVLRLPYNVLQQAMNPYARFIVGLHRSFLGSLVFELDMQGVPLMVGTLYAGIVRNMPPASQTIYSLADAQRIGWDEFVVSGTQTRAFYLSDARANLFFRSSADELTANVEDRPGILVIIGHRFANQFPEGTTNVSMRIRSYLDPATFRVWNPIGIAELPLLSKKIFGEDKCSGTQYTVRTQMEGKSIGQLLYNDQGNLFIVTDGEKTKRLPNLSPYQKYNALPAPSTAWWTEFTSTNPSSMVGNMPLAIKVTLTGATPGAKGYAGCVYFLEPEGNQQLTLNPEWEREFNTHFEFVRGAFNETFDDYQSWEITLTNPVRLRYLPDPNTVDYIDTKSYFYTTDKGAFIICIADIDLELRQRWNLDSIVDSLEIDSFVIPSTGISLYPLPAGFKKVNWCDQPPFSVVNPNSRNPTYVDVADIVNIFHLLAEELNAKLITFAVVDPDTTAVVANMIYMDEYRAFALYSPGTVLHYQAYPVNALKFQIANIAAATTFVIPSTSTLNWLSRTSSDILQIRESVRPTPIAETLRHITMSEGVFPNKFNSVKWNPANLVPNGAAMSAAFGAAGNGPQNHLIGFGANAGMAGIQHGYNKHMQQQQFMHEQWLQNDQQAHQHQLADLLRKHQENMMQQQHSNRINLLSSTAPSRSVDRDTTVFSNKKGPAISPTTWIETKEGGQYTRLPSNTSRLPSNLKVSDRLDNPVAPPQTQRDFIPPKSGEWLNVRNVKPTSVSFTPSGESEA